MGVLFSLLFLGLFAALVAGLIKPSILSKPYKGNVPARKTIALHLGLSTFVLLLLAGATSGSSSGITTQPVADRTSTPSSVPIATELPSPKQAASVTLQPSNPAPTPIQPSATSTPSKAILTHTPTPNPPTPTEVTLPTSTPVSTPAAAVYYKNCDAVRAAGAAPIYRGQPGYGSHLDKDKDGVGCE